jgi:hypothetical protein
MAKAGSYLSRKAVVTILWLLLWGVGVLAWIASLPIALVALDKAILEPSLTQPLGVAVRILVGLVAVGTASLPIAAFLGGVRRAAKSPQRQS